ncbi:hypothetical protein EGW08_014255 [Elysia chlorotica]|uniref:Uncharacterized protein n=1 Tax=Elysia chlorotica TaxID=188477 RepID=A0A3S0ZY20_ELYCH|nr:hypothetical protein EGW08_014255 [Elysia chlorotica]
MSPNRSDGITHVATFLAHISITGHISRSDSHTGHISRSDSHTGHISRSDSHTGHISRSDPHTGHISRSDSHTGHISRTEFVSQPVMFIHVRYNLQTSLSIAYIYIHIYMCVCVCKIQYKDEYDYIKHNQFNLRNSVDTIIINEFHYIHYLPACTHSIIRCW